MQNLDWIEHDGRNYPVRYKKVGTGQSEASTSIDGILHRAVAADAEAAYWSLGQKLYQYYELPRLLRGE